MYSLLFIALMSMGVQGQVIILKSNHDNSQEAVTKSSDDMEKIIVTNHIPSYLQGSLKLTTGELKLFAGHALNYINHQCPNVDAQKIFQVQKYISKRIASTEPVKGQQNKDFVKLIENIKTCSLKPVIQPVPVPQPEKSPEGEDEITLDENANKDFTLLKPKNEQKSEKFESKLDKWSTLSREEKEKTVDSIFADDSPAVEKQAITTDEPTPPRRLVYSTHIIVPSSQISSPGFFSWISSIWSSMHDFFGRVFGGGRNRRSTEFDYDDSFQPTMGIWMETLTRETSPGKKAFIELIDELCRIYCDACQDASQMLNFKLAARELLKFVFEDTTGMNLVASHYLDPTFIRSLKSCSRQ